MSSGPQRVAAIIAAHNVGHDIATTIRSCRAIAGVDLIVVVDDGSDDNTGRSARLAGAVVVRHSVPRGRASARETGMKVAAMRDREDWPPRLLLFLSADVGESAIEATTLVNAVSSGAVDCAIACHEHPGNPGFATRVAATAIRRTTGWECTAPLSENLCITRDALNRVIPFANGYGLEPSLIIELLVAGFSIVELPCSFEHTGADRSMGHFNRQQRYANVLASVLSLRLRRLRLPAEVRRAASRSQVAGSPYPEDARLRSERL